MAAETRPPVPSPYCCTKGFTKNGKELDGAKVADRYVRLCPRLQGAVVVVGHVRLFASARLSAWFKCRCRFTAVSGPSVGAGACLPRGSDWQQEEGIEQSSGDRKGTD